MKIDIVTIEDLKQFKTDIVAEFKAISGPGNQQQPKTWLRSAEVRKTLNISSGTLQNLRIKGHLPFKKVGGTLFYSKTAIGECFHRKANLHQLPLRWAQSPTCKLLLASSGTFLRGGCTWPQNHLTAGNWNTCCFSMSSWWK